MIDLLQPVRVGIPKGEVVEWTPAVLVGRTINCETQVQYDVRLPDGAVLSGIPYGLVEAS